MRVSIEERNRMVMSVLPFVRRQMSRYFRGHPAAKAVREDVEHDVVLFLMRAAETYNPKGGASYLTYVNPHVYPRVAEAVNRNLRVMPARRNRARGRDGTPADNRMQPAPDVCGLESVPEPEPVMPVDTPEPKFRTRLLEGLQRRTRPDSAEMFVRVYVDGESVNTIAKERCVRPQSIRGRIEKVEKHFWKWAATVRNEAA